MDSISPLVRAALAPVAIAILVALFAVGCSIDFCNIGPTTLIACDRLERCPDGSYQNPGGYYLPDGSYNHENGPECIDNSYTCTDGTAAADGTPGGTNGANYCASCDDDFVLDGDNGRCREPDGQFELHPNGVTVVCAGDPVGAIDIVNGIAYTKRREVQITEANAATSCTSGITNMNSMFKLADTFNSDISSWDTSDVIDMSFMFQGAVAFDQAIGNWNTQNVINMMAMFDGANAFNQNIGDWDVSNVIDMRAMFLGVDIFNQDIGGWNTANVTSMEFMFSGATAFDQDIGSWNVSRVTDMQGMFADTTAFNQDLSTWCVTRIISAPSDFATGANAGFDVLLQPQWGTCPVSITN